MKEVSDDWDVINLSLGPFHPEDIEERAEAQAEVWDPAYLSSRQDADADGEADDSFTMPHTNGHTISVDG